MLVKPSTLIMRHSNEVVLVPQDAVLKNKDKITLKESDQIYSDLSGNRISTVDIIVEIHGGSMSPLTKVLFKIILVWAMDNGHMTTKGF